MSSNDRSEGTWLLNSWLQKIDRNDRAQKIGTQNYIRHRLTEYLALGTCFSENGDLLSQWRGYAQDGKGFAINFNADLLNKWVIDKQKTQGLSLKKIEYGIKESYPEGDPKGYPDAIKAIATAFGGVSNNLTVDDDNVISGVVEYSENSMKLEKHAISEFFRFKDPSFEEEREWRLIHFNNVSNYTGLKFREANNLISPYLEIEFPKEAVVSITLGPSNPTPIHLIELLLQQNGYECNVRKSTIPYVSSRD